jgi:hypothetical protein
MIENCFEQLTRSHANNGGAGWAVGDLWSAAGDSDLLGGVHGRLGHNGGGHEGNGGD